MKLSESFFITRREFPKDEDTISSKLLIKSGMLLKNDSGIYTYLPIGLKVLENIKNVINDEMKRIGANEVLMPSLINSDFYVRSNRHEYLGSEMFDIESKNGKTYNLCPTHEELFAYAARYKIKSYKDLHFTLYQISNKYRDEDLSKSINRKKEFCMADAYSFDADDGGLDISYDKMFQAYRHIFNILNIDTLVVSSDPYSMQGLSSEEFQVLCDYGEDKIVKCTKCTYASKLEDASGKTLKVQKEVKTKEKKLVRTPNVKTIKELSEFLDEPETNIIKSLIFKVDDNYKMILLKGDDDLNESKLVRLFKTNNIEFPSTEELESKGIEVGFIGPVDAGLEIIADNEIRYMSNCVCGSNMKDYHYINVNPGVDFRVKRYADLKYFDDEMVCPKCKSKCDIVNGIEVGHIFKLGDVYSKVYDLKYMNEVNELGYVHMGSYGIGLERCLSAIVERNHDDKGIVWPFSVAPFKVAIVVANIYDKEAYKYSKLLYEKLNKLGIDTILDDRRESIGVKFNDMDLIGIPIRITVGKNYKNNQVEFKLRNEKNSKLIKTEVVIEKIQTTIEKYSNIY